MTYSESELHTFTDAYITCALWTSGDSEKGIESFWDSGEYFKSDIDAATLEKNGGRL